MPAEHPLEETIELTTPVPTHSDHKCIKTTGDRPWFQFISQWYLLFLHASYSLIFTLGMVYLLNGKEVAISGNPINTLGFALGRKITQTAVTTLISVCLVLAKVISASWQSLAAWRCVFILLEKHSLSLADISCMASFRLPTLSVLRPSSPSWPGKVSVKTIAVLILLLAWPCQFANPIASGSVSWIPANSYTYSHVNLTALPLDAPPNSQWSWYIDYENVRDLLVKRSAAYASLAAPLSGSQSVEDATVPSARRMAPQLRSKANETTVSSVTVPIFEIDSFQWVTSIASLPEGIQEALKNRSSAYLTITSGDSPLEQTIGGTAALLNDSIWAPPDKASLPAPHIVSGKRYAAILVSRPNNNGEGQDYDCRQSTSEFNPLPTEIDFVNNAQGNDVSNCIAVAELQIRAGVTLCSHKPSLNSSCLLSSGVLTSSNLTVSPDPLVTQVLDMMPQVQALVEALTWHDLDHQHGKLELRLRNSLTQAYQAAWSDLTEFLAASSYAETGVFEPHPNLLMAQVSPWRMCMWLGINTLLVLSGILLLVVQSTCNGKTVNDPVVTAIMLDSSEVIKIDKDGLCNATDIGKGHGDSKKKLTLKISGENGDAESASDGGRGYMHPQLRRKPTISKSSGL